MVQIFLGVGLIVAGVIIALVVGGVSGGPKARRARILALGKWPAILVTSTMFGLPMSGFFVILLWFSEGSSVGANLTLDIIIIAMSLLVSLGFGWPMVSVAVGMTQIDAEIASLDLPPSNESAKQ